MVIFIAVAASKIASTHGNQVSQYGMPRGGQGAAYEAKLTKLLRYKFAFSHKRKLETNPKEGLLIYLESEG
ncbi:MAG: hypothetical protein AABN95_06655 [Acidobacteriota bacterium]